METIQSNKNTEQNNEHHKISNATKSSLLFINCVLVKVGSIAGPLLMRLYYLHGGKKRWLSSWLLTAGFPLLIFPISVSFFENRKRNSRTTTIFVTPWLVMASAFLGFILGFSAYLYSIGISYLPISIYSLLCTTQLAFTAIFAFLVVRHKFTHYSINVVVLMILGSAILGLHLDEDRPNGVSDDKYRSGFFMTIVGAAIHGFMLPAVEYTYMKAGVPVTTNIVMQIQFLIMMFATLFCTVPMIINKDFQGIAQESREFGLGARNYFMIIIFAGLSL
ncbi:purine permease 1-like [Apium graveolens]|uniref:purine permease 1-like n=1 Tax=Apium graveolens TaxID=4045 RepID=UPI003D7BE481